MRVMFIPTEPTCVTVVLSPESFAAARPSGSGTRLFSSSSEHSSSVNNDLSSTPISHSPVGAITGVTISAVLPEIASNRPAASPDYEVPGAADSVLATLVQIADGAGRGCDAASTTPTCGDDMLGDVVFLQTFHSHPFSAETVAAGTARSSLQVGGPIPWADFRHTPARVYHFMFIGDSPPSVVGPCVWHARRILLGDAAPAGPWRLTQTVLSEFTGILAAARAVRCRAAAGLKVPDLVAAPVVAHSRRFGVPCGESLHELAAAVRGGLGPGGAAEVRGVALALNAQLGENVFEKMDGVHRMATEFVARFLRDEYAVPISAKELFQTQFCRCQAACTTSGCPAAVQIAATPGLFAEAARFVETFFLWAGVRYRYTGTCPFQSWIGGTPGLNARMPRCWAYLGERLFAYYMLLPSTAAYTVNGAPPCRGQCPAASPTRAAAGGCMAVRLSAVPGNASIDPAAVAAVRRRLLAEARAALKPAG